MFADEEIIEMVRPLVKMKYPLSRIEKETGLSHGTAARVRKLIESEGDVPSVPSVPSVPAVPNGMCGMNGTLDTTGTVGTIDTEDGNHEA